MAANRKNASYTALFAAFLFLQLCLLRLGNAAGRGYLPAQAQELVYYGIQLFVVLGFLTHALLHRLCSGRILLWVLRCVLAALLVCAGVMLFASPASASFVVVTFLNAALLGCLGGAVYLRMAACAQDGRPGLCMGLAYAAAIALQYVLQLRWTVLPLLAPAMLGAFGLLFWLLPRSSRSAEAPAAPSVHQPAALKGSRLVFPMLITAALLLFSVFYTGYIHHLQVQSGYTDFNVYTWPRLLWIPSYLFFGWLGDCRQGRLVPLAALCVSVLALLNSVLTGITGAHWLNMCLYYVALSAAVSYYNLTFWRLAPGTGLPALWAPMGRVLDSTAVLVLAVLHLSELPVAAVMGIDVALLVGVIVLMALGGEFNLAAPALPQPAPTAPPDPGEVLRTRYALTPTELRVLRELVLTEDKQTAIADRLSIKVRTVQANVTALYRKTGVSTRAGLVQLYRDAQG